jgi:hypothetical protein
MIYGRLRIIASVANWHRKSVELFLYQFQIAHSKRFRDCDILSILPVSHVDWSLIIDADRSTKSSATHYTPNKTKWFWRIYHERWILILEWFCNCETYMGPEQLLQSNLGNRIEFHGTAVSIKFRRLTYWQVLELEGPRYFVEFAYQWETESTVLLTESRSPPYPNYYTESNALTASLLAASHGKSLFYLLPLAITLIVRANSDQYQTVAALALSPSAVSYCFAIAMS